MEPNIHAKLNAFGEISRRKLAKLLKGIPGKKNFIIESYLIKPLERICGVRWLQSNGIDKIYKFEDHMKLSLDNVQVFFISTHVLTFKHVLNEIEAINNSNPALKVTHHIILVPKVLSMFEGFIEKAGLHGKVYLYSFPWTFMMLDANLYSFEMPLLFSDLFVYNDLSLLTVLGKSLSALFLVTGRPDMVISIGKHSQNVARHSDMFNEELEFPLNSDFGAAILMDRSIDYVSALLTPVTYSGLLNEVFKVNCGSVEEKSNELLKIQSVIRKNSPAIFALDSESDVVFRDIKNRHISEVSNILGEQARQLKSEKDSSKEMVLSEIKTYVQTKLKNVATQSRFLSYHLKACEQIITDLGDEFENLQTQELSCLQNLNKGDNLINIEDLICSGNDYVSLRLICLMSLTQKFSYNEYFNLKLRYLQRVGYNYLYIFHNLITCGLLIEPTQTKLPTLNLKLPSLNVKKDFYTVASKMKLVPPNPEAISVRSPTCPSYVFGGSYIPVVVQLIRFLTQSQTDKEFMAKLELFDGVLDTGKSSKPFPLQNKTILVCIVGGITYAEVAAFNLLEKLLSCKIMVCSDCVISANDLLSACV